MRLVGREPRQLKVVRRSVAAVTSLIQLSNKIDNESESNLKLANEFSQLGSSNCQGFDDECYAEIIKDDIVDLGKMLLPPTSDLLPPIPDLLPMVPEKTDDER
ncbi:uncharacterized protein LOC130762191 [Actinidia eriantha]|uniref:uncharacterized protein LOC130762191 n=1 Tax=Actinidia eriantha TaxID=165200 RepID=UPI0025889598|nr:uncharacterized protein LOC130762191 [Actinidia eriantha]